MFVDEYCDAASASLRPLVMVGGTILHCHLHVDIGQQRKGKVIVFGEALIRNNRVITATQNCDVFRVERRTQALKSPPLCSSSTR